MSEQPLIGRITALSELRRFAVQQPVDAAHRIRALEEALAAAEARADRYREVLNEIARGNTPRTAEEIAVAALIRYDTSREEPA